MYPQPGGAKWAAEKTTTADGQTSFKIVVRLRQQPGTYVVHDKGKSHAFDMWSTDRRGTLILEALEVYVEKSKDQLAIPTLLPDPVNVYTTTFKCPVQQHMFDVLQLLKIPQSMFDMNNNRCYCSTCYPDHWKDSMDVAGETYAIPRGWTRFGMLVDPVFAKVNDIWKSWQIAFHGCHPKNVLSILKNRMLLIPHDVLPDGTKLQVGSSADKNQNKYFLSPAIGYSAHPWYAKPVPFTDTDGKRKYFQTVLVFKVRPGSYSKKDETEGGVMKMYDDYSIIKENEVEWFSSRRGCTHPYGLLVRVLDASDLKELNAVFHLSDTSPFKQTFEFSL